LERVICNSKGEIKVPSSYTIYN